MSTIFSDRVDINGIVFNDRPSNPAGSGFWGLDGLDGWERTPEIDLRTSPVGGAIDGEEIGPNAPFRARHLVAAGYVTADDRATAELLKDVLWRDAFPSNTNLVLTRYESVPKFLTVRVSGPQEFVMVGPSEYRWVVPLIAGDPFKYGATVLSDSTGAAGQSTGGRTYPRTFPMTYGTTAAGEGNSIVLFNAGTVASPKILLELTGPLNNGSWRISNETTGDSISFGVDVAVTDTLTIDFRAGLALLNGYPIGASIIGDFWKLATGNNIIKLFTDYNPAITITATAYSAWK